MRSDQGDKTVTRLAFDADGRKPRRGLRRVRTHVGASSRLAGVAPWSYHL
ncbi:hypothetical protein [Verrucomicrobium spinosum]|nr:hypothetical protein [Verrucomicrobium spinosum]